MGDLAPRLRKIRAGGSFSVLKRNRRISAIRKRGILAATGNHLLAGKTSGLPGCGNTGIHARALGADYVSPDELFAQSDVLDLQMPLFSFNTGIINKENIAKMKGECINVVNR